MSAELGQPEPLREKLSGFWSRRIDGADRLVYRVKAEAPIIVACRCQYV
jgi:toxin YoeB